MSPQRPLQIARSAGRKTLEERARECDEVQRRLKQEAADRRKDAEARRRTADKR